MRDQAEHANLSTAAVIGIAAAAALVPLNSTMIAVALPRIAVDFDVSTGSASILVTVYLVAMLVLQPLAGRLGDAIGNRRIVNIALVGIIACSAVAAVSTTFLMLVVARVAQAVFSAALGPGVQALLRAATPPLRQGRTFGMLGSVIAAGAASGPVIGGGLIELFDWNAIFVLNIPVAAAALVVASRVRPANTAEASAGARDDGAREEGSIPDEPASAEPAPERIANPVFIAAFAVQSLSTLAQYALLLLTPIILDARGWSSGATGLVLSALTLGTIVMAPRGGRFGDRRGRRLPTVTGLAIASVGVMLMLVEGRDTSTVLIVVALAVFGLGWGAATPNMMTTALQSVPLRRTGSAAGVFSMSRYAGSITTSVLISVLVTAEGGGTRFILAVSMVSMLLATVVATRFPHRPSV